MKKHTDKTDHIYSIIILLCVFVVIVTLLYSYFEKGGVTFDGWMTLLLIISINLMNINYWKEYLFKD
jgi:hypothetical protein